MGKTTKFEKYSLELTSKGKTPENLPKIISEFEKICRGEISEQNNDLSCNIRKQFGISFMNEDEKEIGSVCFNDLLECKKFCESIEEGTSTFDERGLPIIKYNNIADPFPFFSYSIDGIDYNHITREDFQTKFPEYPLGNVNAKPVIRCIYRDSEVNYYGYDERNNIKKGYYQAEFGFLVTIAGNQVFVHNQEELKELLNSLCLGEEELCEEKALVKKKNNNFNLY